MGMHGFKVKKCENKKVLETIVFEHLHSSGGKGYNNHFLDIIPQYFSYVSETV